MTRRRLPLALALSAAALAGTAHAAPFSPFDVRAAGMGGTGVASAKSASAALFNPAMLSAQAEGDKFQFLLGAGATVADDAEMFDSIDTLQTYIDAFNNAATDLDIYNAAVGVQNSLNKVDRKYLIADIGTALSVGVPSTKVGVGVFVTGKAYALATPTVAASDQAFLSGVIADYLDNGTINVAPGNFPAASTATGVAVAVTEYGVALSRKLDVSKGVLEVGVTPKMVDVSTFEYTQTVDNFDDADIDADTYEKTDSGFDLDVGAVYKTDAASPWQYGLVVKNVLGDKYKTIAGRSIDLGMQARAGAAYVKGRTTFAADLDLAQNDGVAPGTESQFLGLGAEYDLKYVQLRAGYRLNVANSDVGDVASIGLGLGPIDVSVMGNGDEIGGYLQLGFGW